MRDIMENKDPSNNEKELASHLKNHLKQHPLMVKPYLGVMSAMIYHTTLGL